MVGERKEELEGEGREDEMEGRQGGRVRMQKGCNRGEGELEGQRNGGSKASREDEIYIEGWERGWSEGMGWGKGGSEKWRVEGE